MNDPKREDEIKSLNLDDLDVEELEHRLEMAVTVVATSAATDCPMLTTCQTFDSCYVDLASA